MQRITNENDHHVVKRFHQLVAVEEPMIVQRLHA